MAKLKPCPFCGCDGALRTITRNQTVVFCTCGNCGAKGPVFPYGSKDSETIENILKAIEGWNRRGNNE